MCNGSQVGTTGTGDAKQTDNSKAIGFDGFNQSVTGNTTMTLTGQRTDHKNIPTVFSLKVRGGCEVDSKGKKAGKGALINENIAMTLGVSQDQTIFTPKTKEVIAAFEGNGSRPSHKGSGIHMGGREMYTLNHVEVHGVIVRKGEKCGENGTTGNQ